MDDDTTEDPVFREMTGRYGVVIEGEPPVASPAYAHLMRKECENCGSPRLFLQGLTQRPEWLPQLLRPGSSLPAPYLPLFQVTLLCGNCGVDEVRRDPDDRYTAASEK